MIAELDTQMAWNPIRGDGEHSLEIQLPFLQRQLQDFALVPIIMSADDPAAARRLADALAETIQSREERGQRTLLVASSDLHHIEDYDLVRQRDQRVVDAIAAYDLDALTRLLMAPGCTVCGRLPILTVLHAGRALQADATAILHHTTSGDVTGQRQPGHYTEGYLAAPPYQSH
jgi:AmmeMemoRadiSam system protein B